MSASSERGPGRPPGITEARLEKQRRVCAMHAKGIAVETIAAVEECEPAYVRMLLNAAKRKDEAVEPAAESGTPQPHRLSRRIAQTRAWEIVQQRPTPTLGLDANAFWIRLIVEIHESGDGFRLGIGNADSRFRTRSDLELLFSRADQLDIDEWLKRFFARGRLIDIDGIDIAIPPGMKLTAAENLRVKRSGKSTVQPPQDGQTVMLHAVPGDLSDATEIPPQTQIKPQLNLHTDATEIPEDANLIRVSVASLADGRAAAAAAYAKESNPLAAAVAAEPRAGGATETRIKFAPDDTEIPPADGPGATEINSKRSLAELTAELATLAGLGRAPNAEDLGWVQAWTDDGFSPDAMRSVIEIKRAQMNGKRVTGLRYFDGPMRDSRKAKGRLAAVAPTQASPAPLSDADQALRDLLKPCQDAWFKDRSCPFAPAPDTFKAACLTEKGKTLAYRWLELWAVWDRGRRPRDLKPPDFTLFGQDPGRFEAALLEIEEELTAPDPPEAAD